MKTEQQILDARKVLVETLTTPGLRPEQSTVFSGMLNALAWVCDSPNGSTLERLLAGEPVVAGQDPAKGLQRLKALTEDPFTCPKCGQPKAHSRIRGMFCLMCD
jgi:hypothetical protein